MKGPSTRLSEPGPPVRPLKEKELGTVGELSTSNPKTEVPEAPNVSARGADDFDMGDEVAQRGASDAESIEGDEVREPRRRNSPSDPMSWEIGPCADRACKFPIMVRGLCPRARPSRETPRGRSQGA